MQDASSTATAGLHASDSFIAVDWGTTNRRAYRIDAAGAVTGEMEDDKGVTAIETADFPAAVAEIRAALGDLPLLLAGMVGSNRGWREAPYVPAPAGLADLAAALLWVEPGRVGIVPGVSFLEESPAQTRADVMRGEEVQVFGLLALAGLDDALLCHPGTHTKWVAVRGGRLTRFRTAMTGELFALLRDHSILAPLLQGEVGPDEDFDRGVAVGLAGANLAAELFTVRARVLLGRLDAACAAAWTSGLLVGADVAGALADRPEGQRGEIVVVGRPSLNRLYAAALDRAGAKVREFDGAPAFVAGMDAIRKIAR